MKEQDVPQDPALFNQWKEICYAVDKNGKYTLASSAGWDPSNFANHQAWEVIAEQVGEVIIEIKQGKLSPLAYHMIKNQMDSDLLSKYVGIAHWRVKRHLKPKNFKGLSKSLLNRYANLFGIHPEELQIVPDLKVIDKL
jgi:hypothetical protein